MKIVFLGNPNVGKSALINNISGSKIKVGNWPGVTVEKREATYNYNGKSFNLVDLPGTYNLDGSDNEERITHDVLLSKDYDLIVNVVDATNLERNLYLTLLARELQVPMVLLLNFDDEVSKSGMVIDTKKLQRYLQMPVFKTSATKSTGIKSLKDYLFNFNKDDFKEYNIYYESSIDKCIIDIYEVLVDSNLEQPSYGFQYLAYRLFERQPSANALVTEDVLMKVNDIINDAHLSLSDSTLNQIQMKRYSQIHKVLKDIIDKNGISRYHLTKKIDGIVLNKYLGLPIFIIFAVYFLSLIFNVANPLVDWIDGFVANYLSYHVGNMISGMPDWFQSMIIDGILAGVGGVLTFTPLMYFIYLLMGIVEESGYMSRIAFLLDRAMRSIGLDGKAFISMILGFGCTVPAIVSTRTLSSERSRKATTMMLPFMSCGARLPVYALFGAAFFGKNLALVIASLYILGLVVAIIIGLIMKKLNLFAQEDKTSFVIELPPYRIPELKVLLKNVNSRVKGFISRVVSVIMIVIFAIWALNYFPNGNVQDSYLTKATTVLQPVFMPAGFGESKELIAAIPTSIAAKEAVVGTIKQLVSSNNEEEQPEGYTLAEQGNALVDALKQSATAVFTLNLNSIFKADVDDINEDNLLSDVQGILTGDNAPLKAYAYMVYILLLVPCVVALATIKKEFDTKFMIQVSIVTLIVPYVASVLIFQIGNLLFY